MSLSIFGFTKLDVKKLPAATRHSLREKRAEEKEGVRDGLLVLADSAKLMRASVSLEN